MGGWRRAWPGIYLDDAQVICGDAVEVLRDLGDATVHCVVTDPPYELAFMGKKWDGTGIAFRPDVWAECLRVLKPGGHMVVFGGTRTFHRLTCAVEDAGFEIRDCLMWLYGTGFPKSLNIGKAIDRAAGAEREVIGTAADFSYDGAKRDGSKHGDTRLVTGFAGDMTHGWDRPITAPATDDATRWEGWGTALKPAWEPIILARKPLAGTVAGNVLAHGTGALNIDGCRVAASDLSHRIGEQRAAANEFGQDSGWNGHVNVPTTYDPSAGRWPANVVLSHSDGCVEVGTRKAASTHRPGIGGCQPGCPVAELDGQSGQSTSPGRVTRGAKRQEAYGMGRQESVPAPSDSGGVSRFFPVFECQPGCPVAELDAQSGQSNGRAPGSRPRKGERHDGDTFGGGRSGLTATVTGPEYSDKGGASRYFATFDSSTLNPCGDESTRDGSTSAGKRTASNDAVSLTDGSGNRPTDQSRPDMRYTTETETRSTMTSPTSSASLPPSMTTSTDDSEKIMSSSTASSIEDANAARTTDRLLSSTPDVPAPTRDTAETANVITSENGEPSTVSGTTPTCAPIDNGEHVRFRYNAKASSKERPKVDGVSHPTCKPLALVRWLVRMVAPPEGIVLDPFAGSGTTLEASGLEGFRSVGIESAAEYIPLIEERLRRVTKPT